MEEKQVLSRLQALCSRREYCRADVLGKAAKALEGDLEAARRVCDALVAERYVDDLRYASAYAREKSCLSGWGSVKIRHALLERGLDGATVDAALQEVDPGEADGRMRRVLEGKSRLLAGDPRRKDKLLRFALSRGYPYAQAAPVVEALLDGMKTEEFDN